MDFIQTYCTREFMQSKLLVPILAGLYYVFSHKAVLTFSWVTTSVYPISLSTFLDTIQSFINEVKTTEWSTFSFQDVKQLASYSSSVFPFAVTHLNSVLCLQELKDQLVQSYPSFCPVVQRLIEMYQQILSVADWETSSEESDGSAQEVGLVKGKCSEKGMKENWVIRDGEDLKRFSVGVSGDSKALLMDPENDSKDSSMDPKNNSKDLLMVPENDPNNSMDISNDPSIDSDTMNDFLLTMESDIFAEEHPSEDLNRERLRLKKHRRRLEGRKTKAIRHAIKQPQWRAQRFRKATPPTKEEFKLLQEVNRTNINNSFVIVLDISNIAVNYGNKHYCCKGIKLAIDYFTSIGHKVIGFMHRKFIDGIKKKNFDYYTRMTPDDIPYLKELVEKRIICTCPDYEDAYILQYAIEHRGIVVSNDLFRDFPKRYPFALQPIMQRFLDTHVMHYAFTEDSFCPSKEFIYPDLIEDESECDSKSYEDIDKDVPDERVYYYENSSVSEESF